jgi:hypothetical protein
LAAEGREGDRPEHPSDAGPGVPTGHTRSWHDGEEAASVEAIEPERIRDEHEERQSGAPHRAADP